MIIALLKGAGIALGLLGFSALLAWITYDHPWIIGVVLFVVVTLAFAYRLA